MVAIAIKTPEGRAAVRDALTEVFFKMVADDLADDWYRIQVAYAAGEMTLDEARAALAEADEAAAAKRATLFAVVDAGRSREFSRQSG